jgi:hypothetical protein
MREDLLGYVHRAYLVALGIEGNFTDEELAVACAKKCGGNVQSYRKRGHELRRKPQLLKYACHRACNVTGKPAAAYTAVPWDDPRCSHQVYRMAVTLKGDFTDEELALACFKKYGGNQESFRKCCFKFRRRPALFKIVGKRKCRVTKKPATAYTAVPLKEE